MILYIPTCSLNINNILSTDSISPAAQYATRKVGNKRFFPVVACPSEHAVFLYSKIPSFKVEDRGMENYRVVIAIEANSIGQELKKIDSNSSVDTYICESTIYFNPQIATFFYEGKNAYQACAILAEQSLENKSFPLYRHGQIDRALEFKWDMAYCKKYQHEREAAYREEDARIDRIKGAIICFYAGLKQVNSPELATLKKDARRIKNIFSAIANSTNRGLSKEQETILEPIVKEFCEVFSYVDPVTSRNKDAINSYLSSSETLKANADVIPNTVMLGIISELGLTRSLMQLLKLSEPFDIYTIYDIIGSSKFADLFPRKMAEMDRAISVVERELRIANPTRVTLTEKFSISSDNELTIIDDSSKLEFYNQFINALIKGKHLDNPEVKPSLAVALLGGQTLKTLIGEEKWNTSSARDYINALLSNIQNGTPFDILSDDHDILQAFAAFSLKGADIDKLTDCLSQNGLSGYHYAWGYWGAAYGYSQLPKTFTKDVITKDTLPEVYQLLFPVAIQNCEESVPKEEDDLPLDSVTIPDYVVEHEDLPVDLVKSGPDESLRANTLIETVDSSTSPEEKEKCETLRLRLKAFRSGKRSTSLSDKQIGQIIDVYKTSGYRFDEYLISRISKIKGIGEGKIESLRDYLGVGRIKKAPDSTLFEQELLFVTDAGLTKLVKGLRIGDPKVEMVILDDIQYVQKKHMNDSPQDNMECIKHLDNLLFVDNGKHLKKTPNNEQIVEQLIAELKIRYR